MNAMRRWPRPTRVDAAPPACPPGCPHPPRGCRPNGALPERHDGDARAVQVLDQPGLVTHVAQQDDGVAMARLQHAPEGDGLLGMAMGVAQDDVVAALAGLDGHRLDGAREERVRDLAHDDPEQHGPGARAGRGPMDSAGSPGAWPLPGPAHASRVRWAPWSRHPSAPRDTVLCETPVASATSRMVMIVRSGRPAVGRVSSSADRAHPGPGHGSSPLHRAGHEATHVVALQQQEQHHARDGHHDHAGLGRP